MTDGKIKTRLVGYVRKTVNPNGIDQVRLNLNVQAFEDADGYEGKDGEEYKSLQIPLDRLEKLMDERKEVTAVVQETMEWTKQ